MKIEITGITKSYKNSKIIEDISLTAGSGEMVSILGPSGVGKTTILKIISGLLEPDAGRIFVDGNDISGLPAEKRGIAYIFQDPSLFPHMNVYENIAFGIRGERRKNTSGIVERLLSYLHIEGLGGRMPSELSGGQQQRVAIARALAVEPGILLMDEPFSNLDPHLKYRMGRLLKELQKRFNLTVIFVTHDRSESLSLSDRMAVLLDGRVRQFDTPSNVYYKPGERCVADFFGPGNYISGSIAGDLFRCGLGDFEFPEEIRNGSANGRRLFLYLRPEAMRIISGGSGFRVTGSELLGREMRYRLEGSGLEIVAEDYSVNIHEKGSILGVEAEKGRVHYMWL